MKKFLLTLLGASLLCGLSPHPLSAQTDHSLIEKTYTFIPANFNAGLITLDKRVNGALEGATDPTDFTLSPSNPWTPTTTLTEELGLGWGQIQLKSAADDDDPLVIDFDFTKCSSTPPSGRPAW